jgi:hypothetical protein
MLIPQRHGAECIQIQITLGRTTQSIVNAVDPIGGFARDSVEEVVFRIDVVVLVGVLILVVSLVRNVSLVEFGEIGFKVEVSVQR